MRGSEQARVVMEAAPAIVKGKSAAPMVEGQAMPAAEIASMIAEMTEARVMVECKVIVEIVKVVIVEMVVVEHE